MLKKGGIQVVYIAWVFASMHTCTNQINIKVSVNTLL